MSPSATAWASLGPVRKMRPPTHGESEVQALPLEKLPVLCPLPRTTQDAWKPAFHGRASRTIGQEAVAAEHKDLPGAASHRRLGLPAQALRSSWACTWALRMEAVALGPFPSLSLLQHRHRYRIPQSCMRIIDLMPGKYL